MKELVDLLTEKTAQGEQQWTTCGGQVFATQVDTHEIRIEQTRTHEGPGIIGPAHQRAEDAVDFYRMKVLTSEGQVVDALEGYAGPTFAMLHRLWLAAERRASGRDEVITSLIEHLKRSARGAASRRA